MQTDSDIFKKSYNIKPLDWVKGPDSYQAWRADLATSEYRLYCRGDKTTAYFNYNKLGEFDTADKAKEHCQYHAVDKLMRHLNAV